METETSNIEHRTSNIEPAAPKAQGQGLDGINLQEVLDSARNADQFGRQQFFTPVAAAEVFASVLPKCHRIFTDLTMGDGNLIRAARPEFAIGCDIDPRCARQPKGTGGEWNLATADLTKLYPLLCELSWRYDLGGFNPPFSLEWHTERLMALAESECEAVKKTFAAYRNKPVIDSTLATLLIALDRLSSRGEFYFICNQATAIRFLGEPDLPAEADAPALRSHLWCWLTVPPGLFPNTRDFDTAVLYFSATDQRRYASHRTVADIIPLHLTAADASAEEINLALAEARARRYVLKQGISLHGPDGFTPNSVAMFRTAREEYRRLYQGAKQRTAFNLWLDARTGLIRRHLTPFQEFSGKIPKPLIQSLTAIDGQTPMALVVQKPTRLALLKAVRSEFWTVDPALVAAVETSIREYHAHRAPFYPLNDVQRLGFLDEEDAIECKQELAVGNALAGRREVCFVPGQSYPIETSTRQVARSDIRPNILGVMEHVTYHGQELVIKIQDGKKLWHSFGSFKEEEQNEYVHPLEALLDYFTIPEVADVALVHPEKYAANLAKLDALQAAMNESATLNSQPSTLNPQGGNCGSRSATLPQPLSTPGSEATVTDALAALRPSKQNTSSSQPGSLPSGEKESAALQVRGRPTKRFTFRRYQRDDIARFCIHPGGIFAWDPGLGKTVALFSIAHIYGSRRNLIVAPEGLHAQIIEEAKERFGLDVRRLNSQADFYADKDLQRHAMHRRNGRESDVAGWWITHYGALGYNGADEWLPKEKDNELVVTAKITLNRERHPLWENGCDEGIGVVRSYGTPHLNPLPKGEEASHAGQITATRQPGSLPSGEKESAALQVRGVRIKCLFEPSLATLVSDDFFEFVGCDEAVRLKSTDSFTSLGVRALNPAYRVVLTGTPIKNHLDDIFWLAQWGAGGHAEATARWPYENSAAAKERFANEHMLIEENHTKAEKYAEAHGGRSKMFKRRTPKICNIHRLWKLLGNIVLRRRKDDIGEELVPKTIVPIHVKPGTAQQAVYKFHVDNPPDFTKDGKPMNVIAQIVAQLQNLRQAALCPDTKNLSSACIRLHKVRQLLHEAAVASAKQEIDDTATVIKYETIARTSRDPDEREFASSTLKAMKLARLADPTRNSQPHEAAAALAMVEKMIAGNIPVDVDAICKAAPSLAAKIRPAVEVENNTKTSRSWTDHNPKQAAILKLIEELLSKGEQVTVMTPFTHFNESLHRRLLEAGVSSCLMDGNTSPAKRGIAARKFKRREYSVMVAGQKAMGEGHSFECCSHLILPSIEWAYDVNRQSEDRVHRLNSPKPVTIYACSTENTVDARLLSIYREKGDSSCLALDGRLFADKEGEINLGQLLAEAIQNFDPTADTIDESDIEKEWEENLRGKLRHAESRFREWHPPIVPDATGKKVTSAEVRKAVQLTDAPASDAKLTPPERKLQRMAIANGQAFHAEVAAAAAYLNPALVNRLKAIPSATYGALIGSVDAKKIEETRAAFTAFCGGTKHHDWREAWRAFEAAGRKIPKAKADSAAARSSLAFRLSSFGPASFDDAMLDAL